MAILPCIVTAQSFKEVIAQYPNEPAVFVNYRTALRLYIQNEQPVAERTQEHDLMVLSENNAGLFSRSAVYHSGFNELTSLDAYTILPDSKKKVPIGDRKTTASSSNAVFYDDVKETSFDFPSLSKGAIAHVQYTQFLKEAHLLSPFFYSAGIPGIEVVFTVSVPAEIEINYIVKNDPKGLLQLNKERKRGQTIYTWTMRHVKNESSYGDAPDDRYFEPHVIVYITSFTNSSGKHRFLQSVADLYKWNASFTAELNKTEDATLKRITDSITNDVTNKKLKAAAIYSWVQKNIRYVAFENGLEGFRPRQAAEVCSKRYGDCKDMSSIITQMLRMAGIEAYYTWIGTRDIPYEYSEVPLPIVDNHMISSAFIDNQWFFLDGTSPNSTLSLPPSAIQGKQALVGVGDTSYKVLVIPVIAAGTNTVEDSTIIHFTANGIAGTETVWYKGYFGEDIYNALLYRDEKSMKDYVKARVSKASNKYLLGEYKIEQLPSENKTAVIYASFEIPDYGKKVGSEYYINLHLGKIFDNQTIDTSKRKVPREIEYLYEITSNHILQIPDGYKVAYKPDDISVETDYYTLSIKYKQIENKLFATQKLTNKILMLQPSQFVSWNKPLAKLQAHYKEQIVLEKM